MLVIIRVRPCMKPVSMENGGCYLVLWRFDSIFLSQNTMTKRKVQYLSLLGTIVSPNYMLSARDLSVLAHM